MAEGCRRLLKNIFRTKRIPSDAQPSESELQQTLSTLDLTLLGIGSMVGVGLYVLSGVIAESTTGPSIVVSYIIAGVAALFAALCYAEIAGRVPHTGSAYIFTYIAMGEICAFFIGWNLFLEYVLSAASVGRSMSGYIDSLCDHAISNFTIDYLMGGETWDISFIAEYPDVLGGIINIAIGVLVLLGASLASWVNMFFLVINVIVICIIFGVGMKYADIENWERDGGFAPFGVSGVLSGASMLFYAYVGFDVIAMSNEEAKDPKESVPRASYLSVIFAVVVYSATAAALTLMIPYTDIDADGAFVSAFNTLGVHWAKWVVSVGALSGMMTVILCSQFCGCRLVYAMSKDRLFFSYFAGVNQVTKVPIRAGLATLLLTVIVNVLFSLEQLVSFLSIGTLSAYLFVSCTVIVLRYRPEADGHREAGSELSQFAAAEDPNVNEPHFDRQLSADSSTHYLDSLIAESDVRTNRNVGTLKDRFRGAPVIRHVSRFPPGRCVLASLVVSVVLQFASLAIAEQASDRICAGDIWAVLLLTVFSLGALLAFLVIPLHQQTTVPEQYYSIKWVPLVPGISILCCIILLLKLEMAAWLRFFVWFGIGLVVYLCYGYRHSHEAVDSVDELDRELVPYGLEDGESNFYGSTSTH